MSLERDIEKGYGIEPKGPFYVEIGFLIGKYRQWDLWAELETYQDAVDEAQVLENHAFPWRIMNYQQESFQPTLRRAS